MATPPLICKADIANGLIERAYFDRCTLMITRDTSLINSISFCNYFMEIDDYLSQSIRLKAGTTILLDHGDLGTYFGECKFLLIKATYPLVSPFTEYTNRYINLGYLGNTYPIGNLHIWTGNPGAVPGSGIAINPNSSDPNNPTYDLGGVLLSNPHSSYVDLDILIATSTPSSSVPGATLGDNVLGVDTGDFIII